MSIPVAPTPVLEGKNAKRFDRLVKQGLKNPVEFVPTPEIDEVKKKIAKESEEEYKLKNHSNYQRFMKYDLGGE